jgi:hypothetical protein
MATSHKKWSEEYINSWMSVFISMIYLVVGIKVLLSDEIQSDCSIDFYTYFMVSSIIWLQISLIITTTLLFIKVFKTKKKPTRKLLMNIFYYQAVVDISITSTLLLTGVCDNLLNVFIISNLSFSKACMLTVNKLMIIVMIINGISYMWSNTRSAKNQKQLPTTKKEGLEIKNNIQSIVNI